MVDEVPVTPPPTPESAAWWTKLYQPAMLSAIAMLITAIGGIVGVMTAKTLRKQAEKDKK